MNNWMKRRFALSDDGAKNLKKGIFYSILMNLVLLLPSVFVFIFLYDCLGDAMVRMPQLKIWMYVVLALVFMGLM